MKQDISTVFVLTKFLTELCSLLGFSTPSLKVAGSTQQCANATPFRHGKKVLWAMLNFFGYRSDDELRILDIVVIGLMTRRLL